MIIIAGHLTVDADRRDDYVAAFADLVRRARQAPGCLDVAITADPADASSVRNFERWESQEHLDAWRQVADAPSTDIEIHSDEVLRFDVAAVRSPF